MTWHVEVVPAQRFLASLETLHRIGASITSCRPCAEGYRLTYVTRGA